MKKFKINSYQQAGVNLKKVHKIQNTINSLLFKTKNQYTKNFLIGHYAGLFSFNNTNFCIHTDGVGTKILVAQALKKHNTIGIDAVAMNVNDIVCIGAKPLVGVDYIALSKEDDKLVNEIFKGLIKGCQLSGIALVGGETAILADMFQSKPNQTSYDLAMSVVGVCQKEILDGSKIKQGDLIIGLESSGLHSNGFSLARKILDIKKWGNKMLTPTKIYSNLVLEILENAKINGLAHITGGAFSKLSRLGKVCAKGFLLDSFPEPSGIFKEIYEIISNPIECYKTFNMGIGFVLVTPPDQEQIIFDIATKFKTKAFRVGKIIPQRKVILKMDKKEFELANY